MIPRDLPCLRDKHLFWLHIFTQVICKRLTRSFWLTHKYAFQTSERYLSRDKAVAMIQMSLAFQLFLVFSNYRLRLNSILAVKCLHALSQLVMRLLFRVSRSIALKSGPVDCAFVKSVTVWHVSQRISVMCLAFSEKNVWSEWKIVFAASQFPRIRTVFIFSVRFRNDRSKKDDKIFN